MRRREFISLLAGLATAWPFTLSAQKLEGLRRVAVLDGSADSDADGQERHAIVRSSLRELGWIEGKNLKIEPRWGEGNVENTKKLAGELVALEPDLIYAFFNAQVRILSQQTSAIPIVFIGASDPVGAGYVQSFAHPGRNITGFTLYEPSLGGKWLEIIKEIAPAITQVALIVNPDTAIFRGKFYVSSLEAAAKTLNVEPLMVEVRNAVELENAMVSLGQKSGSGVIVAPDTFATVHNNEIVTYAEKFRMPTIYGGLGSRAGLVSYGPDVSDTIRRSAVYVDRILKGERPSDLPVQRPTKYRLIINLKTANAIGLQIPPSLLTSADEVIE